MAGLCEGGNEPPGSLKTKPPAHNNKQESIGNPSPPSLLPIQQLHDIEEEEDHQIDQLELLDQQISSSTSLRRKKKNRRHFTNVFNNSPSPTFSVTTPVKSTPATKNKVRTRSVTSTTSSDTSGGSITKMQAEQGSIGDLKSYHNRYLRNRRHTLANVRRTDLEGEMVASQITRLEGLKAPTHAQAAWPIHLNSPSLCSCSKTGLNLKSDTKKDSLMKELGQEIMG
ncbi:hypothetical protein ANN_01291 [Periplaneta americana]|uniref:Uncharacterized protein n=1 Tax=Periplaneta americana TaxID=6978 RepID=A0ABQ8TW66_PERAM|nr:hypothetical protein ANN_01291 [Periplaneta americana]